MTTEPDGGTGTIRHIAEHHWEQPPNHFGGALSKMLVRPEVNGSRDLDYRISSYQPGGHVGPHAHARQEQIYHVLEGQALVELGGEQSVVGPHSVVYIPSGVRHALTNTGLGHLVLIVVTTPPDDEETTLDG